MPSTGDSTGVVGLPTPGSGYSPAALAAPAAGDTTGTTDPSFLSSLGGDITGFLNSPLGNLTEFGTLAAAGLSQASSQKSENQALAGNISDLGKPFSAAGAAELGQLTGGPSVGGPLGASIDQQTGAAANLGKIAQDYSTGQLTPAQQQQVSDYVAQQKSTARAELAAAGITDPNSQQFQSRMQQIDNNAAELGQSLITSDTAMAEGALTAVQQTYSGLLNQALTSSEFGLGAEESAVTLQIQQDTALANSLQTLFAGIAQGFGNAMRQPSGGGGGGGGTSPASTAAGVAKQAAGGADSSGVASSAAGGATPAQLRAAGGSDAGIAAGGPSAADQATYDANNQQFLQDTQTNIDQTPSFDPNSVSMPDLPSYTSEPVDFTGDPLSNFTSDPFALDASSDPFAIGG
jgi:hypothetical protein